MNGIHMSLKLGMSLLVPIIQFTIWLLDLLYN